ncbi:hypothetical protein EQG49_04725 [Periweissella cryptocerci]|uniref:Uncharacterized protein n=1 Tax=Periweissella cryptocerci TaxID=2506420 RepID=A0A4P6YT46_9LACO|nr:hypothetical protein [Periweissella cryptocerci]QBO35817.1 hypothetical protein EQG49_04725 [Periweissella cryptocerci]
MLKMKKGSIISSADTLFNEYELSEKQIKANIDVDMIAEIFKIWIKGHSSEQIFLILEVPVKMNEETEVRPGVLEATHSNVYYLGDCDEDHALKLLGQYGDVFFNDGVITVGFGSQESQEEIQWTKYNVMYVIGDSVPYFATEVMDKIGFSRVDHVITAWDTISAGTLGVSKRFEREDGTSIIEIVEELKGEGLFLNEVIED